MKSVDKGSCVVVWDREGYLKEADRQLNDTKIYRVVKYTKKMLSSIEILLHFLHSKIKVLFFYFWVTNSKLENKTLHFELLTRSWKIFNFTSSYKLDGSIFIFSLSNY